MPSHITQTQRIELSTMLRLGMSQAASAAVLGFHPSTISRELLRGRDSRTGRYHARAARIRARTVRVVANQHHRKLPGDVSLETYIEAKLRLYWSPEQIAGRLALGGSALRASAQTIYDWLYQFRTDLLRFLRSQKQHYRRTRQNTLRRQQREALLAKRRIDQRPVAVEHRSTYGHWEGDTMVSRVNHARLGTLVERKSGYLRAFLVPNGESLRFADGAAQALQGVPQRYLQTMTLDNGTEMQSYERLERLTSLQVFFAYPYHSWERGSNENTNGLLRQFYPKKTSLRVAQAELDKTVQLLNTRPRKRLGYKTPAEMFEAKW